MKRRFGANCRPALGSLHYDFASHLRVNRAVVRIRSRLGEGVGEFFVRIQHLGLEHTFGAHRRMWDVVTVGPGNRRSNRHGDRLRPENEIIDFNPRRYRRRLCVRGYAG